MLPYVKVLSESMARIFKKHKVNSAMKPHCTLRNMLAHPKDQLEDEQKAEGVYKIPCLNCDKLLISKTKRTINVRVHEVEHHKEVEKAMEKRTFTRSSRKESVTEYNKSAVIDHAKQNNHIIDWKGAKFVTREPDDIMRGIK